MDCLHPPFVFREIQPPMEFFGRSFFGGFCEVPFLPLDKVAKKMVGLITD